MAARPPAPRISPVAVASWVTVAAIAFVLVVFGLLWPDDEYWEPPVETYDWRPEVRVAPEPEPEGTEAAEGFPGEPAAPVAEWSGEAAFDEVLRLERPESMPDPLEALEEVPAVGEGTGGGARPAIELPLALIERVPEDERDWLIHTVVPLEEVDEIAYRYAVRPEELRMWNGIGADVDRLRPGAKLRVKAARIPPPRMEVQYAVGPGDSWWSIGTSFGVDSYVLRAQNWDASQRLSVGQPLRMWIDPVVFQWIVVEEGDDSRPTLVRPGAVGIGPPQHGRLVNGVEIPQSDYYVRKLPPSSYGTSHAVRQLLEAVVRFRARSHYLEPLQIGAMSRKHGGPLQGHVSHQSGRDLDIRLPLKARFPPTFEVTPKRVDWLALWQLIGAFADTRAVVVIFLDFDAQKLVHKAAKAAGATDEELERMLQAPIGPGVSALVRHAHGHEDHIHVRFDCGAYEPECIDNSSDAEEPGD